MSHSDAEDWIRRILNDVCVELGFCLSPTECARLEAAPPRSVDSFTDAIFLSEGLDPRLADGELRRLVRTHVALHFRIPVEKPIVADIGTLLDELAELGVNTAGSHYEERKRPTKVSQTFSRIELARRTQRSSTEVRRKHYRTLTRTGTAGTVCTPLVRCRTRSCAEFPACPARLPTVAGQTITDVRSKRVPSRNAWVFKGIRVHLHAQALHDSARSGV
jgi:hypothetical protein